MPVACFFTVCAAVVLAMFGCYAVLERRTRDHWIAYERRAVPPADGYRVNQQPTYQEVRIRSHAPAVVRLAAASAQIFGITFVPGLLAALIGLAVYGLGLFAVPGLIVAWSQFPVAAALLRRAPEAPLRARRLARLATVLNLVIVFGAIGVMVPLVAAAAFTRLKQGPARRASLRCCRAGRASRGTASPPGSAGRAKRWPSRRSTTCDPR